MKVPSYPEFRDIQYTDKDMFDALFTRAQPRISECTFASLYLFRHAHSYKVSRIQDTLVVLGKGYDGIEYFLPPMDGNIGYAMDVLFAEGKILYGADERFIAVHAAGKEYLAIDADRDNFDYLYLRQNLAELPGNRYHKKKNRINYFTARHAYVVEPFSADHMAGALVFLDEWQRVRSDIDNQSLAPEIKAAAEGVRMAGKLGLEGIVVFVNGILKALVLGERLNRDTAVCHFEKADPFLEGLYQLADQEFNQRFFTDCVYANREQDLGHPGLRSSKLSYHPVEMIRKYRVRAKNP